MRCFDRGSVLLHAAGSRALRKHASTHGTRSFRRTAPALRAGALRCAEERCRPAGPSAASTWRAGCAGGQVLFVRLAFIDRSPTKRPAGLIETHGFVRGGSWHTAHSPSSGDGVPGPPAGANTACTAKPGSFAGAPNISAPLIGQLQTRGRCPCHNHAPSSRVGVAAFRPFRAACSALRPSRSHRRASRR